MSTARQRLGDLGEKAAEELLAARGYRIVARKHRCTRGEVDLVAEQGDLLVAAAATGVRISDGSTNVLPVGDTEQVRVAWALHARLVRRSLERR